MISYTVERDEFERMVVKVRDSPHPGEPMVISLVEWDERICLSRDPGCTYETDKLCFVVWREGGILGITSTLERARQLLADSKLLVYLIEAHRLR